MFRPQLETSDGQLKLIQNRIDLVETHFASMCTAYGAYCRKTARLRDTGDGVANTVQQYAAAETLDRSMRHGLAQFSDCLTAIEDYRQTMIERLEVKVVGQLVPYEAACKTAKENLKTMLKARARQLERKRRLQKARDRAPLNRQEISLAETELTKATVDAGQTLRQLEDLMDSFEQKKSQDIKKILLNHVNAELLFHVKAIEIYTKAYNCIKAIDDDEDLNEFRDQLKLAPAGTSQLDLSHGVEGSSPTRRTGNMSSTHGSSMSSLVGHLRALHDRKNGRGQTSTSSEDDDQEEEDDDDEDDDLEEEGGEEDVEVEDLEESPEATKTAMRPLPPKPKSNGHHRDH